MRSFKGVVGGLVEAFVLIPSAGDDGIPEIALVDSVKALRNQAHLVQQLATWSDSQNHDRSCIELASGPLCDFCEKLVPALVGINKDAKKFKPASEIMPALRRLLCLEQTKPQLEWMVGADQASKLLDHIKDLRATLDPACEICLIK